ncbi:hypothetical protein PIB30_041310 [Stylosanthes scabra]|uniref:Uncharacterized protein n=1 Tax=Stylosanthes scabra TaxID=79078 RepID=A0ABU6SF78_9FABA|nr:hypothetical protein [Stylosanthes scabra]
MEEEDPEEAGNPEDRVPATPSLPMDIDAEEDFQRYIEEMGRAPEPSPLRSSQASVPDEPVKYGISIVGAVHGVENWDVTKNPRVNNPKLWNKMKKKETKKWCSGGQIKKKKKRRKKILIFWTTTISWITGNSLPLLAQQVLMMTRWVYTSPCTEDRAIFKCG